MEVTFESKAGDVASLEVARSGTSDFTIDEELTDAELNSGNRIVVTDEVNFRLEYAVNKLVNAPRCISELVSLLWMPLATLVKYQ